MEQIRLFPAVTGLDGGPKGHNEDTYRYYCRSARADIAEAKSVMEEWFGAYPDKEKADLRRTLVNDFDAGFFELFLFALFSKMGFSVSVHPTVPNSSKTPDFLVSGHGQDFYLEAKVSYYEIAEDRAMAKRLNVLYEVLDQADILDHFIYLGTVRQKSKRQPRAKEIRRVIEASINGQDAAMLFDKMNAGLIQFPPLEVYEDDDIYIEFGPVPKSPEGRGIRAQRAIGIYGGDAKVLQNCANLRKALKTKAGRYDVLNRPYLIAVNAIDMMALDQDDVMDCLFGSTCVVPDLIQTIGMVQEFRQHDGFFTGREDKGQHTRVSAALITKINPHNWKDAAYWIFEHPKAKLPIQLRSLPLVTRFIQNDTVYRTRGTSFDRIINGDTAVVQDGKIDS